MKKKLDNDRLLQAQKRRVGLAVVYSVPFVEQICHGIVDYAQGHGGWDFTIMPEMLTPSVDWLRHMRLDGALALVITKRDRRLAQSLRFPVVNLASHLDPARMPTVTVDHARIGAQAAEFLIKKGFSRFAYYGTKNLWFSEQRRIAFVNTVSRTGPHCRSHVLNVSTEANTRWRDEHRQLLSWLRSLKPPVGLMASTDLRAAIVLDACAEIGLRVPDDVAVIGVDNNIVVCETRAISITSVARNDWQVGWEAAAMLHRLMAGGAKPSRPHFVAPGEIVQRKSTDTFAVDDPVIARLLEELRANMGRAVGVEWLIERSGWSRRTLEMRFRENLGKTPHAVITQLRLAKARALLVGEMHMPLTDVAAHCGFTDLKRFREVFRKHTGMIPKQFRKAATQERTKRETSTDDFTDDASPKRIDQTDDAVGRHAWRK